jgi:hypothetical protein
MMHAGWIEVLVECWIFHCARPSPSVVGLDDGELRHIEANCSTE